MLPRNAPAPAAVPSHTALDDPAGAPLTTVVVVPREAFSRSIASLENVLSALPPRQPVVVVDGASPRHVRERLRAIAQRRPLTIVSSDRYLAPNEARNLGWRHVTTKYTIFIDNDVDVEPGWLDHLESCAEDTGAWAVAPLCCISAGGKTRIHMAGALNRIERQPDGRRVHVEQHLHSNALRHDIEHELTRQPTELVEFHCAMVRTDLLDRLGPLDEALRSLHEHCDLCLAITKAGGSIWFEPRAVATYAPPSSLAASDCPYWLLRWSNRWNATSVNHFARKWDVGAKDGSLLAATRFGRAQRRRAVPWPRVARRGGTAAQLAFRCWARAYETAALLRALPRRRRSPATVEHPVCQQPA